MVNSGEGLAQTCQGAMVGGGKIGGEGREGCLRAATGESGWGGGWGVEMKLGPFGQTSGKGQGVGSYGGCLRRALADHCGRPATRGEVWFGRAQAWWFCTGVIGGEGGKCDVCGAWKAEVRGNVGRGRNGQTTGEYGPVHYIQLESGRGSAASEGVFRGGLGCGVWGPWDGGVVWGWRARDVLAEGAGLWGRGGALADACLLWW